MSTKEQEAGSAAAGSLFERDVHALPQYSVTSSQEPTVASPFNFPDNEPPPTFAAATASGSTNSKLPRPIAIPQITPGKTAAFLDAYAQPLLQYGITPESWRAFLTTISAFLAAKVSEQAVAHAADIGRHVNNVPKRFGRHTVDHAKSIGHNIRDSAKSGNYIGAVMGVVGGTIALPVGTAIRAVGATLSLPGTAISAGVKKPRTPRERAAAYAMAANEKWLGMRGLQAQLVDTAELARVVGVPLTTLLDLASASADHTAAGRLITPNAYISGLETLSGSTLELGAETLWLIVVQTGSIHFA